MFVFSIFPKSYASFVWILTVIWRQRWCSTRLEFNFLWKLLISCFSRLFYSFQCFFFLSFSGCYKMNTIFSHLTYIIRSVGNFPIWLEIPYSLFLSSFSFEHNNREFFLSTICVCYFITLICIWNAYNIKNQQYTFSIWGVHSEIKKLKVTREKMQSVETMNEFHIENCLLISGILLSMHSNTGKKYWKLLLKQIGCNDHKNQSSR